MIAIAALILAGSLVLYALTRQNLAIAGAVYVTLARRPGYHLPLAPVASEQFH